MAKPIAGSETNLAWAAAGILAMSAGCALFTAILITRTLEDLNSSQAMALIITDLNKFLSDDARTGQQLSEATQALKMTCDVACALVASSVMVSAALGWKVWKIHKGE